MNYRIDIFHLPCGSQAWAYKPTLYAGRGKNTLFLIQIVVAVIIYFEVLLEEIIIGRGIDIVNPLSETQMQAYKSASYANEVKHCSSYTLSFL